MHCADFLSRTVRFSAVPAPPAPLILALFCHFAPARIKPLVQTAINNGLRFRLEGIAAVLSEHHVRSGRSLRSSLLLYRYLPLSFLMTRQSCMRAAQWVSRNVRAVILGYAIAEGL